MPTKFEFKESQLPKFSDVKADAPAGKPFVADNPPNFLRSKGKDAADSTGGKAAAITDRTQPSSYDPMNNAKAPPVPSLRKTNPTLPNVPPKGPNVLQRFGNFITGRHTAKPSPTAAPGPPNPFDRKSADVDLPAARKASVGDQSPAFGGGYTPKQAAVNAGEPPRTRAAGDILSRIKAYGDKQPLSAGPSARSSIKRESLVSRPVTNTGEKSPGEQTSYTPKLRGGASLAASPRKPARGGRIPATTDPQIFSVTQTNPVPPAQPYKRPKPVKSKPPYQDYLHSTLTKPTAEASPSPSPVSTPDLRQPKKTGGSSGFGFDWSDR
jgi:hypothetical protein